MNRRTRGSCRHTQDGEGNFGVHDVSQTPTTLDRIAELTRKLRSLKDCSFLPASCFLVFALQLSRRRAFWQDDRRHSNLLMRLPRTRFAQVRLADARVVQQRLRVARQRDAARLHDVRAARSLEREERVLLDEQNRYAL